MAAPSTLSQAALVAGLDLKRRLRDRSVLIQVFLAPLVLALIIGGAFGGGGGGLGAEIWLADGDGTPTSAAIVAAIAGQTEVGDPGVAFIAKPGMDEGRALQAVDSDEADAAVLIPHGFTAAVQAGDAAQVAFIGDAGDAVWAGVAASIAEAIANRTETQRVAVATTLDAAGRLGLTVDPASVAALAAQAPTAITVRDSRFENEYNLMAFFAPGMAMIFLFFVLGAAARSLLTERREGTLNRMLAGPTSPAGVLLGKAAGVVVLGLASLLTVWGITSLAFGVDWGDPWGVLLIIVCVVLAIAGISLIVTGLSRTEAQSQAITIVFSLVLGVLGGSFVYVASGFLAAVRAFTPNGQALMAFTDLAAGDATVVDVLPAALILLAIGLVTASIGLVAIRRGLAR
jgi:ABC-2 type transport system permease protein